MGDSFDRRGQATGRGEAFGFSPGNELGSRLRPALVIPKEASSSSNPFSVKPRCGSKVITIEVKLNPYYLPNGKFNDWIVVGVSGSCPPLLSHNAHSRQTRMPPERERGTAVRHRDSRLQ